MPDLPNPDPSISALNGLLSKLGCQRCEITLIDDPQLAASSLFTVNVPALPDFHRRGSLCGNCTLEFFEFMVPDEKRTDRYREMRAEYAEMRERYLDQG